MLGFNDGPVLYVISDLWRLKTVVGIKYHWVLKNEGYTLILDYWKFTVWIEMFGFLYQKHNKTLTANRDNHYIHLTID